MNKNQIEKLFFFIINYKVNYYIKLLMKKLKLK